MARADHFSPKPGRREFTASLKTRDRREANARARRYEDAVESVLRSAAERLALQTAGTGYIVDPEVAHAAIDRWQAAEIKRARVRCFGSSEIDDIYAAERVMRAEEGLSCYLTDPDAPPVGYQPGQFVSRLRAELRRALAGEGLPLPADHPVLPRLLLPFARAWYTATLVESALLSNPKPPAEPAYVALLGHHIDLATGRPLGTAPVGPAQRPQVEAGKRQQTPWAAHIDEWIASLHLRGRRREQDTDKAAREFGALNDTIAVEDITDQHAKRYQQGLIECNKAKGTIKKKLGTLRGYWTFLHDETELAIPEVGPFHEVRMPTWYLDQQKRRKKQTMRMSFAKRDVPLMWRAAKDDQPLADLILLNAYTGARLGSLCDLRARTHTDRDTG
ncbi:MAG: hypothetical protein ACRET2_15590, partial [Steroidobacteraceae bacterium]